MSGLAAFPRPYLSSRVKRRVRRDRAQETPLNRTHPSRTHGPPCRQRLSLIPFLRSGQTRTALGGRLGCGGRFCIGGSWLVRGGASNRYWLHGFTLPTTAKDLGIRRGVDQHQLCRRRRLYGVVRDDQPTVLPRVPGAVGVDEGLPLVPLPHQDRRSIADPDAARRSRSGRAAPGLRPARSVAGRGTRSRRGGDVGGLVLSEHHGADVVDDRSDPLGSARRSVHAHVEGGCHLSIDRPPPLLRLPCPSPPGPRGARYGRATQT